MFNILVVDDDKNIRRLIQAVLETENYTVSCAADGLEALNVLGEQHIDLIILDVMMPNMNGYQFTETIREQNIDIPILMISAKHEPSDKHKGFLAGTDDYITKPIDPEEMLLRIKALFRRAKITSERKITIGSTTLDYDSFSVITKDETQVLPQKEFLLLYKLLSYPGKIFTRIQLMEEIWGVDSETNWETLTVHIARLRKRFENNTDFTIDAVRGLGYKAVKNIE